VNISTNVGKNFNGPNSTSGTWGKLIHVENLKAKISWNCPFNFPRLKKGIWNNAQYAVGRGLW
jgi:hypothetical protein